MLNRLSSAPMEQANTVTITLSGNPNNPTMVVDPHELPVVGSYVLIRFVLVNDFPEGGDGEKLEYQFPETGAIVVSSASAQFPLVSLTEKPEEGGIRLYARIFDFNTDRDDYNYTITAYKVEKPNNLPGPEILRLVLDPIIQNGQE